MDACSLVYRSDTPKAKSLSEEVSAYLKEKGVNTVHSFSSMELSEGCFSKLDPLPNVVMVLGGDGTYLSASRALVNLDIPLVGVNLGSLGFLTEHKSSDVFKILDKILKKELKKFHRDLLQVELFEGDKLVSSHKVLNDLCVERGARPQLVRLNIFSNDQLVYDLKADGLVVSTPTGSTAYNLAAGGPIIYPEANVLAVTPVAPHSLTSRPLVLPDHHRICLELAEGDQRASFTLDGILIQEINSSHKLVITKSKYNIKVLKDPEHNYFSLLREKLKFGERA
jgi:NAD+ kinase